MGPSRRITQAAHGTSVVILVQFLPQSGGLVQSCSGEQGVCICRSCADGKPHKQLSRAVIFWAKIVDNFPDCLCPASITHLSRLSCQSIFMAHALLTVMPPDRALMIVLAVAGFFAKANLMSVAYPAVSPMDPGVFFGGTGRLLAAQLIHIIWIAGELPPCMSQLDVLNYSQNPRS